MKLLFIYSNHATYLSPHYHHGIGFLAASLKKAGHHVGLTIYDCPVERDALIADIERFGPDMIGFSVATAQYKYARLYSSWIKESFCAPMVVGGVHATLDPEKVMAHPAWDYLVAGEGEEALVELADALDSGVDPANIKNLWLRRGTEIVRNDLRPLIENLDSLPYPDREVFDNEHLLEGERKVLSFLAGRGCPYGCTYCFNAGFRLLYKGMGKWVRFRSPQNLLNEIRSLAPKYSPRILDFNDDIFTLNRDWTMAFIEKYREDIRLPFRCNVRVETVDREVLESLKEAGCDAIRVGVEQGDEQFRRTVLKRTMTNAQIEQVFRWAHELGIKAWSFNMLGFPGETPELAEKTLELNRRIRPDHLQISIFNPYPGTVLWEECLEQGLLPENAEVMDGYFVPDTPLNMPSMTREQLQTLHRKFVDLSESIKDQIRIAEKYRSRKIFTDLVEIFDQAEIVQPEPGYVKQIYFTMDEDSRKTLQEHPPSRIVFSLKIPPRSRFEAAVALHPAVWDKALGEGVLFELYVTPKRLIGKGKRRLLLSRHLNPRQNTQDRCWIEVEADLGEFAGKTIALELVTRMQNESKSDFNTAGWANPVIAETP